MMAPMVSIRWGPAAARRVSCAARRGKDSHRHAIARTIATNAAARVPEVPYPGEVPPAPSAATANLEDRRAAIKHAKPFSEFLTDSFNRQHDYLRISITERCNLRCLYCMPEEGVQLSPPAHLLTTPEIVYLASLFVSQGVTKIRLTGGEPTVRRDIVPLMQSLGDLRPKGLRELALTTNGISLHRKLDSMVEAGLTGVNLSLDTLDPFQFQIMTRRKGFDNVMKCIDRILELKKLGANLKLKVNCVVMRGLNERDIIPFVELGREKDIEVRFIEYMPFGGNKWNQGKMISFQEMLDIIRTKYSNLRSVPGHKNDTSKTYEVPGFVGKVGFITSMTNDFCGTCNRLRITSDGNLKVCLHGNAEVSLRDLLRQDNAGEPIDEEAFERIRQIELDRHHGRLNDNTTLGWGQRERELLNVIGAAVKRKAEKHADIGDLEHLTNRPMILIDEPTHSRSLNSATQHELSQQSVLGIPRLVRHWPTIPIPSFLQHRPQVASQSLTQVFVRNFCHSRFLTARDHQKSNRRKGRELDTDWSDKSRKNKLPRTQDYSSVLADLSSAQKQLGLRKTYERQVSDLESRIKVVGHQPTLEDPNERKGFVEVSSSPKKLSKRALWRRRKQAAANLAKTGSGVSDEGNELTPQQVKHGVGKDHQELQQLDGRDISQLPSTPNALKDTEATWEQNGVPDTSSPPASEQVLPEEPSGSKTARPRDFIPSQISEANALIRDLTTFGTTRKSGTIPPTLTETRSQDPSTSENMQQRALPSQQPITSIGTSVEKLATLRTSPDDLSYDINSRDTYQIDDDLTINFGAENADLQSQLLGLQKRLQNSYPKIDSLPYNVWDSNHRFVLKKWLRILFGKWQTRFETAHFSVGEEIEDVLDNMVRVHELDHEASERMAVRFKEVFEGRAKMQGDAEGTMDWDEFDAEMGSWLRDDNVVEPHTSDREALHVKNVQIGHRYSEGNNQSGGLTTGPPPAWDARPSSATRRAPAAARHFSTYIARQRPPSSDRSPNTAKPPQPATQTMTDEPESTTTSPQSTTKTTLPHLTPTGSAHMVSISAKPHTLRTAIAVSTIKFSNSTPLSLIRSNALKKGDVLSVARIAGIMAAKKCPDLIPLCHPISLSHVGVELRLLDPGFEKDGKDFGGVEIQAKVQCTGPTGVEMEALTAVAGAGLTVVDMCKAVDKGMRLEGVRVVLKEGGRNGVWREEGWVGFGDGEV